MNTDRSQYETNNTNPRTILSREKKEKRILVLFRLFDRSSNLR